MSLESKIKPPLYMLHYMWKKVPITLLYHRKPNTVKIRIYIIPEDSF